MRLHHLSAAVLLALSLLTASCLQQSPTALRESDPGDAQPSDGPEPLGEAYAPMLTIGISYKPKDFPFIVEKEWDGEDGAGGRQRAFKDFTFSIYQWLHVTYSWNCPIDVSMAVQSRKEGHITRNRAAQVTAEIATLAVNATANSRNDWEGQGAVFCDELKDRMDTMFGGEKYKGYGARVIRWLR
jgi:hypothetical protein